jgi:hypothetical protein
MFLIFSFFHFCDFDQVTIIHKYFSQIWRYLKYESKNLKHPFVL